MSVERVGASWKSGGLGVDDEVDCAPWLRKDRDKLCDKELLWRLEPMW